MHCTISSNPSIPAENAFCQEAPARWTAAAWALGRRLLAGPVRSPEAALAADLVRRGMVERRGGGWFRITDAGRAAFPSRPCWEYPFETPDCLGTHEWGRLAACDSRPACWRSASAHLCRPCVFEPRPARARVPAQIVRGWTTNVAEFDDPKRETHLAIPSLAEVLRHAPATDRADEAPADGWWSGLGPTDKFPSARVGYPTGPQVKRTYA